MRRLVWLAIVLAVAWCAWWAIAAQSLRSATHEWLGDRRSENWQAEAADVAVNGFPLTLNLTLTEPALADPDTGVAFRTETLSLRSPAWWPGNIDVTLPAQAFIIATPLETFSVALQNARTFLRLRSGPASELALAGVSSDAWQVTATAGPIWAANGLALTMQQSADSLSTYTFDAAAPGFRPGGAIREALRIPQDWPVTFDSLTALGIITFDRPIDRYAVEKARPQPRQITLQLAEAVWGALLLRSSADLTVSENGLISGQLSLQARNWQDMLNLAEASGALPSSIRPQIENILAALARGSGNPNTLDITVEARDGSLFMGFIPLGQLPPLVLR